MKYTAKIDGAYAEQFSSIAAARKWVRESYGRGLRHGESRSYSIYEAGAEVESGFVMNGRLSRPRGLHA